LKSSAISYQINQLADLQLWDSKFTPISLFGVNKYLAGDTRNIIHFIELQYLSNNAL